MRLSLNRVILYVRDVEALTRFYRDTLGLSLLESIEGEWAVLAAGPCEIALHRVGLGYRTAPAPAAGGNSNAKLVLTVNGDLRALRESLVACGVPMRAIKSYAGFAGPLCDGTDPEGNVFQLAQG